MKQEYYGQLKKEGIIRDPGAIGSFSPIDYFRAMVLNLGYALESSGMF